MKKLDVLLIGVTGFTGTFTAKTLAKFNNTLEVTKFTWGLCGRSKQKIKTLLLELYETGVDTSKIPVFVCDIGSSNVKEVTCKANVVINCTGPNSVLSEPIVKACIETSTHYVDISAERYHILDIYIKFHKLAEEANVLIIPACGFAVIPVVSGLMYLEKQFQGTLNTVECYTYIEIPKKAYLPWWNNCLVNSGTWNSMIYEIKNYRAYQQMKQKTYPEDIYEEEPSEIKKSFFHKHENKIWFPYPGPDREAVEFSQIYLYNKKIAKPYHYKMYTTTPYLFQLIGITAAFFLLYYLIFMKCFRRLLFRFPGLFSLGYMNHKGPTKEMAQNTKFTMSFIGKGVNENGIEKSMTVKISGSDPGYEVTCNTVIVSALTLLREREVMPTGGVIAPGAAFRDTQLLDTLIRNNCMKYES